MALKQGHQKRYCRYGHGLTKTFPIVLEMNHILFKKLVLNEWPYQIPSRSDVAAKVDYNTYNLID